VEIDGKAGLSFMSINISKLYDVRFTKLERVRKQALWKVLCQEFLQQFIKNNDTVVDLGAGECEFIGNISCGKKIVVDINRNIRHFAPSNVKVIFASIKHLKTIFREKTVDVIFMSNLLEHLDSKEEVFRLLNEAFAILKKGGRLLVMQPDIKLVGNSYWDFFDHKVPLTFASLKEVLFANGFTLKYVRYPFLPYHTKIHCLPTWPIFLRIYLKVRWLQILFGKQFFICAGK
jgi:ubiquinone/menaquinone biosynthesis C-methylase UbiE